MGSKRDLVVNELDRYAKRSDRLVLEEYSHCEVPAGCGGAILRWIDPQEALPLQLRLWTTGKAEVFFDGAPTRSARVEVRTGAHVLAVRLSPREGAPPEIALALCYSDKERSTDTSEPSRSASIGRKIAVLSGAGATLLATPKAPASEAWKEVGFDDSGWVSLTPVKTPAAEERDWHLRLVREAGARVVGHGSLKGTLWVRCAFDVALGPEDAA